VDLGEFSLVILPLWDMEYKVGRSFYLDVLCIVSYFTGPSVTS